jgi:hypothetical protein
VTLWGQLELRFKTELQTTMSGFFAHLRQAGLPLPSTEPHVEVVDRGPFTPVPQRKNRKILIARKLADGLGSVLRLIRGAMYRGRTRRADVRGLPLRKYVSVRRFAT